jgi:hypothetical protein
MSLLVQIQSESIDGSILMQDFASKFAINTNNLNFKKEPIKLENLMHIYEKIELIEMKNTLKDDFQLYPLCMLSSNKDNFTRLRDE